MIDIAHWVASFIALSVALARLEAISIGAMRARTFLTRSTGWSMIGIDAFSGVIAPFFGFACVSEKLGIIGFALIAISYKWDGAARDESERRRAGDY